MNIALVNPGSSGHLPLSCLFLATWWTERCGHDVRIIDANWQDAVQEATAERFDLIAVSAITPDFEAAKRFAVAMRGRTQAPVTLGGIHATVLPESTAGYFLQAFRGDGEAALPGGPRWDGSLNDYPALRWDLLDKRYFLPQFKDGPMRKVVSVPIVTSRGCPFHCTFCAAPKLTEGRGVRNHTVEWTVNEFAALTERGAGMVCVFDDNFTLSVGRLKLIADAKRDRGLGRLELTCNARVTHFSDAVCEQLARLNVASVLFGWESGNARVLRALKQDSATVEQAYEAIARARRFGLNAVGSVILGSEGETTREMLDTAAFTLHCGLKGARTVFWSAMVPYPGSAEWERGQRRGELSPDMDFDKLRYGSKRGVPLVARAAMVAARAPMLARKIVKMIGGL